MSGAEYKCVAVAEVESFVERCMRAIGTDPQHCKALSQVLSAADVRGHFTHGLHRLGKASICDGYDRKLFKFRYLALIYDLKNVTTAKNKTISEQEV